MEQYYEGNPGAKEFDNEMTALSIAFAMQKNLRTPSGSRTASRQEAMQAIKESGASEEFKQYAREQYDVYDRQTEY